MYDGTLATKGPWQALVTFQQMIILADKNGVVDMTAEAISRHTTIPLEIISVGLEHLQKADPDSRSPDEDGRRIVLLSDHRAWGWRVVNYGHYRKIRSEEERREYHRQYMRKKRSVNPDVKGSTGGEQSQPIAVSSMQEAEKKKDMPPDGGPSLWEFGRSLLGGQGLSTREASSLLGLWMKDWPEATVADALRAAVGKADIKSYVTAILKTKQRKGEAPKFVI